MPDAWLTARGFADERAGAAYDPSRYPGHGEGLFFVGVEGTAKVYEYALNADGSFARLATVDTPFALVAEVQFDRGLLWIVCDEACNGRTATYDIDATGTFAPTHVYARPANAPDVANEGFVVSQTCVDGRAQTFYADDADTDGFSLRSGTLPCTPGTPGWVDPEPSPTTSPTTPVLPGTGDGGPAESALTDASRGGLVAPASVVAGQPVTLTVPAADVGERVGVWLFSTPTDLGTDTATATRTVTVTVPVTTVPGAHRIVVTDASGAVLGWSEITVLAVPTVALPATGGDATLPGALAVAGVLLVAMGAGAVRRARLVRRVARPVFR